MLVTKWTHHIDLGGPCVTHSMLGGHAGITRIHLSWNVAWKTSRRAAFWKSYQLPVKGVFVDVNVRYCKTMSKQFKVV